MLLKDQVTQAHNSLYRI